MVGVSLRHAIKEIIMPNLIVDELMVRLPTCKVHFIVCGENFSFVFIVAGVLELIVSISLYDSDVYGYIVSISGVVFPVDMVYDARVA